MSTQSEAFLYGYLQKCEARLPSRRAQDVTVGGYGGRYDLVHGDRVYPAGKGIAAVYIVTSVPLFESLVASQSRPSAGSGLFRCKYGKHRGALHVPSKR